MGLEKPYSNIPDTWVFDSTQARKGYHLNQFCMTLMKEDNRKEFLSDEKAYLDKYPLSDDQKEAILQRDYNKLLSLGGNVYFLMKIMATDKIPVAKGVASMTEYDFEEYTAMMLAGGRSPDGYRTKEERNNG